MAIKKVKQIIEDLKNNTSVVLDTTALTKRVSGSSGSAGN